MNALRREFRHLLEASNGDGARALELLAGVLVTA
jgi:hypothetical protein